MAVNNNNNILIGIGTLASLGLMGLGVTVQDYSAAAGITMEAIGVIAGVGMIYAYCINYAKNNPSSSDSQQIEEDPSITLSMPSLHASSSQDNDDTQNKVATIAMDILCISIPTSQLENGTFCLPPELLAELGN